MPVMISLLRAINVGGRNSLPMSTLKAIYAELGFDKTQTLLQSGNAVFIAKKSSPDKVAQRIEAAVEAKCGFRPRVLVRTLDELRDAVRASPFTKYAQSAPDKLLVYFLEHAPAKDALAKLRALHDGPEELALHGRALYVYFPMGAGKSKLTAARMDKGLGTIGTARNWTTLGKLISLAERIEA